MFFQHKMYIAVSKLTEFHSSLAAIITGPDVQRIEDWLRDTSNTPRQLEIKHVATLKFDSLDIMYATQAVYTRSDIVLVRNVTDPLNRGRDAIGAPHYPMVSSHTFMLVKSPMYVLGSYAPSGLPLLTPDRLPHNNAHNNRILDANLVKMPFPNVIN